MTAKNSNLATIIRRLIIVAMIIYALAKIAIPSWNNVLAWRLNDNDDVMRVLEVRAWLGGQGFYDIVNHRLNPPNGGDIHWSRLADLPLAIANLILRPFLGIDMAEKAAAFSIPLILGAIFAIVQGHAAKALFSSKIAFFLGVFFSLSTPASMGYFTAGRVDHHGLQLICMLCAFWGLFNQTRNGAIGAGLAIAASLTIGFEMVPILVLMVGWVALRWGIRGNVAREATTGFALSLLLFTLMGFLINVPPSEWKISVNDALSLAQIAPLSVGAILLFFAAIILSEQPLIFRAGSLIIITIAVVYCALQFPELRLKPYWQVDAQMQRIWIAAVSETHPLVKTEKATLVNLGLFSSIMSLLATLKVIQMVVAREYAKEAKAFDNWLLILFSLLVVTILALFWQARMAGQAATIASLCASAILALVYKEYGLKSALILGLVANPLLPSIAAAGVSKLMPQKKSVYAVGGGGTCKGPAAFAALAAKPKGIIAAPIDFGAHALISTHHDVLAAPYHRNHGNRISYNIFLSNEEAAKALLIKHNINYVGICDKSAEIETLSAQAPNGLMAQLKFKKIPAYLRPLPTPKGSNIIAYEFIK